MTETCKIHPDVPRVVLPSSSVYGGTIVWGCAVCNMLEVERLRKLIRKHNATMAYVRNGVHSINMDPQSDRGNDHG